MFDVKLAPTAQKDLKKLSKNLQVRIVTKIDFFAKQTNPIVFAKPLVNLPPSTHRFRVGDYRIAFYILDKTFFVHRIRHRKEVYEN